MAVPTYSFGSMWKKAGWYDAAGTRLTSRSEGMWSDDSVHGGEYSSRDTSYTFRWYGPGPSGDFKFKIPDDYFVTAESFQELDEKNHHGLTIN